MKLAKLLSKYLTEIERNLTRGDATEHTHRPAIKSLVEEIIPGIKATNEPRRIECGAPDFVVTRGTERLIVGYIETKDIGFSLDDVVKSEQLRRYFRSLNNLLLTNYLEFRWYVDGKIRSSASLADLRADSKIKTSKENLEKTTELLYNFLQYKAEPIGRSDDLAKRMAQITHMIRDIIIEAFENGKETNFLRDLRTVFANTLIPDLLESAKTNEFSDMYAQTIAYGLFAARCNHDEKKGTFKRTGAYLEIPKTNPFLRQLFETLTGSALENEPYTDFVEDLVQVLALSDMHSVLEHFGKRKAGEDPVIHFYETFLATYDPKIREGRGVYYTPEPVVSFIVRSIDHILRDKFGVNDGLADVSKIKYEHEDEEGKKTTDTTHRVLILDPACGTGTFLYEVVDQIRRAFMEREEAGIWSGYVKNHLLPRIFGFELLMAPYSVAHFKLGMQLAGQDLEQKQREKWAYDFLGEERLGIYLTNTLEAVEKKAETLFGPFRVITEEANAAKTIKYELPIMVIIGNPPYSVNSYNKGKWITDLVRNSYYPNDEIKEKNPKLLLDDYVKFIRWAQWRIEKTGAGVLGFITNHSYLDNPTFRKMRQNLMCSFDEIHILNLHGNVKRKEKCPDGSKDENVFDIQQGVAIALFVKKPKKKSQPAIVNFSELWGSRDYKYQTLEELDIKSTKWKKLSPKPPFYFFIPQKTLMLPEYNRGWRINDIYPVNSTGIKTHRDHFVFDFDLEKLKNRIVDFRNLKKSDDTISIIHKLKDTSEWNMSDQRKILSSDKEWDEFFKICLYRPFDIRHIYYHLDMIERPRVETMKHLIKGDNLSLLTCRQQSSSEFKHVLCANTLTECCAVSLQTRETTYVFPLYLYPDGKIPESLFDYQNTRRPNLSTKFIEGFSNKINMRFIPDGKGNLKKTFGPEDIFHYIYAVLHAPTYRARYSEFLKIDFPRIPLTSNLTLFKKLCAFGEELVGLHLLEKQVERITKFPVKGENIVENVRYEEPKHHGETGKVWINKEQYFECILPEVWEFRIGGYQVCHKWLKDRKGRVLSYDDIMHYQQTVSAIAETMRIMAEIDKTIQSECGWPVK